MNRIEIHHILEKRFSDIICCSEHIDALINEMHSHGIKSLNKIQLNDNYPIESKIANNIFRGSKFKNDDPTKQQIDAICKYGNKFYNGKISTAPMTSRTTKCSDILQMDEIALHKEFTRL